MIGAGRHVLLRRPDTLVSGHGHLLRGSVWLLASVAANAFFGFAFWLIATQIDSKTDVGRASALFTAVLFINYATNMGLPVAVARYAPDDREASTVLFNWSILYTGASSVLGTVLFLVFLPRSMADTLLQWGGPAGFLIFFAVVFGMSCAVLLEVRLMALRRWGWVFTRVAIVGVVRFALVLVRPLGDDALWLFLVVAGIPALSGFFGVAALLVRRRSRRALSPVPASWRAGLRYSSVNYLGILAVQAPTFALPLIVAVEVSSPQYAAWYVAFSITTVIFLVPHTLGQVLLVEGGKGGADLRRQVRLALGLALGFMAVVAVAGRIGSDIVTLIYGEDYADAADLLPTLVLAGVGWAITSICLTKARVEEHVRSIVVISLTLAVGILAPAVVLVGEDGIEGAARAWLIGNAIAAVTAMIVTSRTSGQGSLAADAAWLEAVDGDEPASTGARDPG